MAILTKKKKIMWVHKYRYTAGKQGAWSPDNRQSDDLSFLILPSLAL